MKYLFPIIILAIAFASCRKKIDIDLNDAEPQLVIEANYSAEDSTVRVLITQTSNYFSTADEPTVDNATIIITDQAGTPTAVPFVASGQYELTNYVPQYGTTYTMTVTHNGTQHVSTCNLNSAIALEPIFVEYLDQGFFGGDPGYLAYLTYQDPAAEGDYIQAIHSVNDTVRWSVDEMILSNDDLTNGNMVERPIFVELFDEFDTLEIELRTIDKRIFDYYVELASLTDPSSAAPANPTYNWTNRALGYFSAHGSSRQTVVVQ